MRQGAQPQQVCRSVSPSAAVIDEEAEKQKQIEDLQRQLEEIDAEIREQKEQEIAAKTREVEDGIKLAQKMAHVLAKATQKVKEEREAAIEVDDSWC